MAHSLYTVKDPGLTLLYTVFKVFGVKQTYTNNSGILEPNFGSPREYVVHFSKIKVNFLIDGTVQKMLQISPLSRIFVGCVLL